MSKSSDKDWEKALSESFEELNRAIDQRKNDARRVSENASDEEVKAAEKEAEEWEKLRTLVSETIGECCKLSIRYAMGSDMDAEEIEECIGKLDELEEQLEELEDKEPEKENSPEHEAWQQQYNELDEKADELKGSLEDALDELEEQLEELEDEEPEDEDSQEHEDWEEQCEELADLIDEIECRL